MAADVAFRYRAARSDGTIELGTVTAPSAEAASTLVAARGAWVLDVRADARASTRRASLPVADLALGLRLLASFLESGLPMSRALAALEDVAPESWAAVLPRLRDAVREGQSLAGALAEAPVAVPPVVIGILRAGEAGSGLARAVRRAAELTERQAATRAAVRAALAYPFILAGAGIASVALLVGVVLPRFAAILTDLGQRLPATTRIVLGVTQVVRVAAIPGALVLAAAFIAWRVWAETPAGGRAWHAWLLTLPIVGPIRRAAATGRFAAALAALLESGVPAAAALRSSAEACGDAAVGARLLAARELVIHGQSIAAALRTENATTLTALRLVRAGEESGRLAEMLQHAATLEAERAERAVKAAVRLLEPALIIAFGGLVAFVAAALLQAVYSVRPGAG